MASNKHNLCAGDRVKVVHAFSKTLSDTTYEVVEDLGEWRVSIRELNEVNPAVRYKPHEADVSILQKI